MPLVRGLLTVSLLLASSGALADKFTRWDYDRYLGGGLWSVTYTPDAGPSYSMPGVMLKAGYELSRQLAVELHFGTSDDQTRSTFGGTVPVSLRVTAMAGVLAKYSLLYQQERGWARLYGLLGASVVDVEAKGQGTTANDNEAGLSFGLGLDLFGSDQTAIVLEWVRYIEQSDFTISTPMIGVVHRF